jgi:hypothetical protein
MLDNANYFCQIANLNFEIYSKFNLWLNLIAYLKLDLNINKYLILFVSVV